MKIVDVVAAVIISERRILCVQRAASKYDYISRKWEFPGGKLENGESMKDAVKREIHEELNVNLVECEYFLSVDHEYPDFRINMHSFICHMPPFSLKLNEHIDFRWLYPQELDLLDWAAADLPIVAKLQN